jgi:hypothetical protein
MRHLPIKLGAAVLTVSLFACFSQAGAMPVLSSNDSPNIASPIEKAGYYGHRYGGYYPYYRHWGGYGYYQPYYGHYGYGYWPHHRYGYNWRY